MNANLKKAPWGLRADAWEMWAKVLAQELREKLKHPIHGYVREDTMISVKEILGE